MKKSAQHKTKYLNGKAFILFLGNAILLGSAGAATTYDITFEEPNYTIGDQYPTDPLTGSAPSMFNSINASGNNFTATVVDEGPTGNRLNIEYSQVAGSQRFEAFSPFTADPGDTYFAQLDFTWVSGGGFATGLRMINSGGSNLYEELIYADLFAGQTLTLGTTYTLRSEIDHGDNQVRIYLDENLVKTATGSTATSFGGLQLNTGNTNKNLVYGIDNVQTGSFTAVPEPATMALLSGMIALSFVALRRRSR